MFKNKLIKFVIKSILVYLLIFSFIIIFFDNRLYIYIGIYTGALLSAVRFLCNAWIFGIRTKSKLENKLLLTFRKTALFILNQAVLLLLLFVLYFINNWIFIGFITGVLLAPLVIVINSITEAIGITKNNFYID